MTLSISAQITYVHPNQNLFLQSLVKRSEKLIWSLCIDMERLG